MKKVVAKLLKFAPCYGLLKLIVTQIVIQNSLESDWELLLYRLTLSSEFSESFWVIADFEIQFLLHLLSNILEQATIKVLSTEMCVAPSGYNLEHTGIQLQNGNIKGAAAQIEDQNFLAVR